MKQLRANLYFLCVHGIFFGMRDVKIRPYLQGFGMQAKVETARARHPVEVGGIVNQQTCMRGSRGGWHGPLFIMKR